MAERKPLQSEPLYQRAEQVMLERIAGRDWPPGLRLPNEFELAEEFGVSQGTIRKALTSLESRGLIERRPGRGTTVVQATEAESLYAFFRIRNRNGQMLVPEPGSEALSRRAATAEERRALQPTSDEVVELNRVRLNDGRPLVVEQMIFPATLFAGIERETPLPTSLYPFLQARFGVSIMTVRESVVAEAAGPDLARQLGLAAGAPVLAVTRLGYDLRDRCVELRRSWYRTGPDSTYRVDLHRFSPSDRKPRPE